jgi:hypothetical protein
MNCPKCKNKLNEKSFLKKNKTYFKNCSDCRLTLSKHNKNPQFCDLCHKYIFNLKIHLKSKRHYLNTRPMLERVLFSVKTISIPSEL